MNFVHEEKQVRNLGKKNLLGEAIFYFHDMDETSVSLLTSEEEKRLAILVQSGDIKARERFICANLSLVINIAKKYVDMGVPFLDLIQEGNLGLIYAVDHFDITYNGRFSSYAFYCIKAFIKKALTEKKSIIKMTTYTYEWQKKWDKAQDTLYQKLNREPTNEELIQELKISKKRFFALKNYIQRSFLSLDNILEKEEQYCEKENLFLTSDFVINDSERIEQKEWEELLKEYISTLTEKEQHVLKLYYGLEEEEKHSERQIGEILSLSSVRIDQIRNKALKKLRKEIDEQIK